MSGFRKFLLQGNLVTTAVAFVIGGAFATVVAAFVAVVMDLFGKIGGTANFSSYHPGGIHIGALITAAIAFTALAAVVYYFIVLPYTKAKERFFPDPEPGLTTEDLLTQIRDLLAQQQKESRP